MRTRVELPTGTVTFLFTDIEGSTRLLKAIGDRYQPLLAQHARLVRDAIGARQGVEVNTEGDAFFAVFRAALDGVRCAIDAQRSITSADWPAEGRIRVRMGLHTGDGRLGGDDYSGIDVNRTARIAAAGHGGQIVISDATRALVDGSLDADVQLHDLGRHRLKDLGDPERLWQVEADGLANDFPTLRTQDARPNNLPLISTPTVGRERQVSEIRAMVEATHLVTLTGPGGIGKSRLARAIGWKLLDRFPDGVYLVALEEAHDRGAVAESISSVLAVRERPDQDVEAEISEHIGEGAVLLILDNLEQATGAGSLAVRLLEAAPGLHILAASRTPLRVTGEHEYAVPTMEVPDPFHTPDLESLAIVESVELFVARAQAVRPDFELTAGNAASVAGICARLDGLPLAIELAAQRIRLLTPEAILQRLTHSLPLLEGGRQDRPARQQTLRGAIAWSYDLLDNAERRLFDRLALFAGGWTLEAAESICDVDGELGTDVFSGLSSLVEMSLVRVDDDVATGSRFAMLHVIRDFAAERLAESADFERLRERHATYYADLVERARPRLVSRDLKAWQLRLRTEEDNLRATLRWATMQSVDSIALRTAGSLWRFWHFWAAVDEGIGWLEAALGSPRPRQPDRARARAIGALAALLYWQGAVERSAELYADAVAMLRAIGSERFLANSLFDSFWPAVALHRTDAAFAFADEALASYEATDDRGGTASMTAVRDIADLVLRSGSVDTALASTRAAIRINDELGRALRSAELQAAHAFVHWRAGELGQAMDHGRHALRAFHGLGHIGRVGTVLHFVAAVDLSADRAERAATIAAVAASIAEHGGKEIGSALLDVGDPAAGAMEALAPELYASAVAVGEALSLDGAVAFALHDDPPSATSE